MVYLTCADGHRSGWARCDQNMDRSGCKSAPLPADVQSHLFGCFAIQLLAASEESCHRFSFFLSFFLSFFSSVKLVEIITEESTTIL